MKKMLEIVIKYKIQIIVIVMLIVLIPIIKITKNKFKKDYNLETVNTEKYFVLESDGKSGIIDDKGNIVIEPKYYDIHIPNPSRAIFVCYFDYNDKTGKCRTKVINSQETELFSKYNELDTIALNGIETSMPYEKNLLKYKANNKYGIIDLSGKMLTEAIYDEVEGLSCKEGELLVKKDEKYGVINNKGVELIKIKYDYISGDEYYTSNNGYKLSGYIVGEKTKEGYRYGYLNEKQKMLLNLDYSEIIRIGDVKTEDTDKNIFIIARKNGQCGLIKNKKVIIDFKYQDIDYSGIENLFIVTRSTKLGVCSSKGKKILPTQYDEINIYSNYIETKSKEKIVYYDLNGKEIEEPKKEKEEIKEEANNNAAKMANPTLVPTQKNGKWGFVDKNSKVVIDYIYDEVTEMNKYGFAGIKKNGKWGSIDEKGKIIQNPTYKLDSLDEISFIGKYYKVTYDYRTTFYTDSLYVEGISDEN